MTNPIKALSKKERIFWVICMTVVAIANVFSPNFSILTLTAVLIGVSAVLFGAAGNVWGQILIAIFSLLYGVISWQYRYWGEMVTYLGMSLPMALWSVYTWMKNLSETPGAEVKINRLTRKNLPILAISGIGVTYLFYRILLFFDTPNIVFSTLSITTSFFAASLSVLRSSYYLFWYALNDLVLIILWSLASLDNPGYIPVVINFFVFFLNDGYGFISWKKREKTQGIHS